jgi:DNA (cytosine-5)-methyltransferase 1
MTARVDPKLVREAWRRFGPLPPDHKLIVDLFAGGGGASLGIEQALGRSPDIAINHDAEAVAMHTANHPATWHLISDVWEVAPAAVTAGRTVGLLWASPDCKHFSKAKGGQPVKKRIRALAWVVVKWAREVAPEIIILENVEEFATWGPLVQKVDAFGRLVFDLHGSPVMVPCKKRKGQTFHRWRRQLEQLGYVGEWRERRAFISGAGTIRRRLYYVLRRICAAISSAIAWPEATHGDPKKSPDLVPWVTAADCIDWSLPCPSIFDTAEEIFAKYGVRAIRPLKPKTMARIAKGIWRYVINAAEPFIIPVTHGRDIRTNPVDEPLRTGTCAKRGEHALIQPFLARTAHGDVDASGHRRGRDDLPITDPVPAILATNDSAIVAPVMMIMKGQSVASDCDDPLRTITAGAPAHGIIAPVLVPRYGERPTQEPRARSVEEPLPVIVPTGNGASVVAAHMMTMRDAQKPHEAADRPAHTITADGARPAVVAAFLAQHNYEEPGHDAREPVSTIVGKGCTQAIVQAELQVSAGIVNLKGGDRRGGSIECPLPTSTAQGGHVAEVRAFLMKYHSLGGQHADARAPMPTVDCTDRVGVVTADIVDISIKGGEHRGDWRLTDIGMRMLTPRERFRAQGFPDSYIIDVLVPKTVGRRHKRIVMKPLSGEAQGRMVGNSVCPTEARALVAANCMHLAVVKQEAATA